MNEPPTAKELEKNVRAAIAHDIELLAARYVAQHDHTDSAKAQGWAILQAAAMVRDG